MVGVSVRRQLGKQRPNLVIQKRDLTQGTSYKGLEKGKRNR